MQDFFLHNLRFIYKFTTSIIFYQSITQWNYTQLSPSTGNL